MKKIFPVILAALLGCSACSTQSTNQVGRFENEPYSGKPPELAEQLRQAVCFIKRYAPDDYPAAIDFDCTIRELAFDKAVSAQLRQQKNEKDDSGCYANADSTKIKIAIAEVLLANRSNNLYQPGNAIFISTYSVCHQLTNKSKK